MLKKSSIPLLQNAPEAVPKAHQQMCVLTKSDTAPVSSVPAEAWGQPLTPNVTVSLPRKLSLLF